METKWKHKTENAFIVFGKEHNAYAGDVACNLLHHVTESIKELNAGKYVGTREITEQFMLESNDWIKGGE